MKRLTLGSVKVRNYIQTLVVRTDPTAGVCCSLVPFVRAVCKHLKQAQREPLHVTTRLFPYCALGQISTCSLNGEVLLSGCALFLLFHGKDTSTQSICVPSPEGFLVRPSLQLAVFCPAGVGSYPLTPDPIPHAPIDLLSGRSDLCTQLLHFGQSVSQSACLQAKKQAKLHFPCCPVRI